MACISWKDSSATSEVAFITNAIPRSDKINKINKAVIYFRQLYVFFGSRSHTYVVSHSNNSVRMQYKGHKMTGNAGNSQFCFPETLNWGRGETKLTVAHGASH